MTQSIQISLSHGELSELIDSAVSKAISRQMSNPSVDSLMTVQEACDYLSCSDVFLWKLRKEGKIDSTNLGRKVLIPRASIDSYLNLKSSSKAA